MSRRRHDRKKDIERHYLEEARRSSELFPQGGLEAGENPDFLLRAALRTIGIEITELCREEPRAEAGRLDKVREKARARYLRRPGVLPVDVSPAFSHHSADLTVDELANSLASFVYAHRHSDEGFDRHLPEGYCHIGVFPPLAGGMWRSFRAFDTVLTPKEQIAARIAEKSRRVADYRKVAAESWLLFVNDLFLGPGEVHTQAEDLAEWRFQFDFDRVLLFLRQPGGTGQVIELRRD